MSIKIGEILAEYPQSQYRDVFHCTKEGSEENYIAFGYLIEIFEDPKIEKIFD